MRYIIKPVSKKEVAFCNGSCGCNGSSAGTQNCNCNGSGQYTSKNTSTVK